MILIKNGYLINIFFIFANVFPTKELQIQNELQKKAFLVFLFFQNKIDIIRELYICTRHNFLTRFLKKMCLMY